MLCLNWANQVLGFHQVSVVGIAGTVTDIKSTHRIKEAGQLLDIPVLDPLILTEEVYKSFADDGLM